MSDMIEVKTADLSGAALDWAVAIVQGEEYPQIYAGSVCVNRKGNMLATDFRPSTDWSQGGPLIEKYKLDIGAPLENQNGPWNAATEWTHPLGYKGESPLIAACRAIVGAEIGDTVSVPAELI